MYLDVGSWQNIFVILLPGKHATTPRSSMHEGALQPSLCLWSVHTRLAGGTHTAAVYSWLAASYKSMIVRNEGQQNSCSSAKRAKAPTL